MQEKAASPGSRADGGLDVTRAMLAGEGAVLMAAATCSSYFRIDATLDHIEVHSVAAPFGQRLRREMVSLRRNGVGTPSMMCSAPSRCILAEFDQDRAPLGFAAREHGGDCSEDHAAGKDILWRRWSRFVL